MLSVFEISDKILEFISPNISMQKLFLFFFMFVPKFLILKFFY